MQRGLIDFAVQVMQAASSANCVVMMTFPEDLGPSKFGSPASIWQRADVQQLETAGLHRYAFYQGYWCSVDYLLPTGVMTNAKIAGRRSGRL